MLSKKSKLWKLKYSKLPLTYDALKSAKLHHLSIVDWYIYSKSRKACKGMKDIKFSWEIMEKKRNRI